MARRKKDRKVKKGIDYDKLVKIWNALVEAGDWMHIAGIARKTGINECTVRYYLDKYLKIGIEETRIDPKIKLRLVRIKPGVKLENILKALNLIKKVRSEIKDQSITSAFRPKH